MTREALGGILILAIIAVAVAGWLQMNGYWSFILQGGNQRVDHLKERFNELAQEVGVEYETENVFVNVVVLKDGSRAEDGVFGVNYHFANGDVYKCGVHGHEKIQTPTASSVKVLQNAGMVINNNAPVGKTTFQQQNTGSIRIGGLVSGSVINGSSGKVVINGVDYSGKILPGKSISIVNGRVFVDGEEIQAD